MSEPRPPASVVIPTRDRPRHLEACLTALRGAAGPDDEILVVDSASRWPDAVQPATVGPERVVRAHRPGASLARNLGWRAAAHDIVAFLDDDVRVEAGWLDEMVAALERSQAGFVTGRVEVPPDQAGAERPVAVKTEREPQMLTPLTGGVLGGSCSLVLRRAALVDVDGFDERLGPGTWFASAEDLDLYDRLFAAGHQGYYTPYALAYHDQWRSRRELLSLDWGYGKGAGARLWRLVRRWPRRAALVARTDLWDGGVLALFHSLRDRYEFGALGILVRLLGVVAGFAAAASRRIAQT